MKRKTNGLIVVILVVLTACSSGTQPGLPPGKTLVPESELPHQITTIVSVALTQTAFPAAPTPIPLPTTSPEEVLGPHKTYQNEFLGIQFDYPDIWYLQNVPSSQPPTIMVASFDPANPPHKLDWTDHTVSIQFRALPFTTVPNSFNDWVESTKQAAVANHLTISSEKSLLIANQPAIQLTLISGSGGVTNQVLTILNARYYEINIEGNVDLAKIVLDTVQPISSSQLKPPDSESPASGICGKREGDPVNIILGNGPDGLPKAGRCLVVTPTQHIQLINQSDGLIDIKFGQYAINLPVGGQFLLDKPVGKFLAPGVHFIWMGPEIWVKAKGDSPEAGSPGSLQNYANVEVGYTLTLPPGWNVDESGLSNLNKEAIFLPNNAEAKTTYLSISLDSRGLDQIMDFYTHNVPDASKQDTVFNGLPAIMYTYNGGRTEYFIPSQNQTFHILTDKQMDGNVELILMSIRISPPN